MKLSHSTWGSYGKQRTHTKVLGRGTGEKLSGFVLSLEIGDHPEDHTKITQPHRCRGPFGHPSLSACGPKDRGRVTASVPGSWAQPPDSPSPSSHWNAQWQCTNEHPKTSYDKGQRETIRTDGVIPMAWSKSHLAWSQLCLNIYLYPQKQS